MVNWSTGPGEGSTVVTPDGENPFQVGLVYRGWPTEAGGVSGLPQ